MCVLEYDYDVVLRCSFVLCVMCHDSNSDEIPMNTSRSYSLFLISSSYPLLLPPLYSFAFLLPFTDLLLTSFIPPSSFLLPPSSLLLPSSYQSVFKLHPMFDIAVIRILAKDPLGVVVFLRGRRDSWTRMVRWEEGG